MVSVTRQKPITLFIDYLFFYKAILFTNTLLLIEFRKSTIWDVPSPLYLPVSGDMEAAFIPLLPRLEICTPSPVESLQVSPPSQWLSAGQLRLPFFGLCSSTPNVQGNTLNASMQYYTFKSVTSLPDNQAFDPQQVGAMDSFPISAMSQDFLQHRRFCGK